MNADDLSASDPSRIAGLLDAHPSPLQAWSPEEIGSILRHQLAAPVCDGTLGALLASSDSPALRDALLKSAGDVLRDPHPPLEVLQLLRRCAKQRRRDKTSAVPPEVPTALYYAAITAAMVRAGARLSELSDEQLRQGLEWLLDQPWLDELTRELFVEGLSALPPPADRGIDGDRTTPS